MNCAEMGRKENKRQGWGRFYLDSKVIFQNYYFCHDLFLRFTDDTVTCFV